jgi:membrane-bound lytic murein transglycosylase MltF
MRSLAASGLGPLLHGTIAVGLLACGGPADETPVAGAVTPDAELAAPVAEAPSAAPDEGPLRLGTQAAAHFRVDAVRFGDLDQMLERRVIRALVVPNKTNYFLDGATQRGISYEALREFEKFLNQKHPRRLKVHVVIIPVTRDQVFRALGEGRADLALANLTVTSERREQVDFSRPTLRGIREVVVASSRADPLERLEGLAGREVWVRPSSSHRESLDALNRRLARRGLAPIVLRDADEYLETEDLLEMANAGLLDYTIADEHLANFWAEVFTDIRVFSGLAVRSGGDIAWALRRDTPRFKELVDEFVRTHGQGTLFGNVLINRYLKSQRWVRNSMEEQELERFRATLGLFQRYAERYDFDWLMMAAQGYQESRLDQSRRSHAGAVGVMQLLPSTARDPAVGIPDIEKLEPNIHAGIKYMRWIVDTYFADSGLDPLQQTLFAFASYNAGPNRIRGLRREAAKKGYDPDVWFRNVEVVVWEKLGREPVQYVSNIYKYYVAYRLLLDRKVRREAFHGSPSAWSRIP